MLEQHICQKGTCTIKSQQSIFVGFGNKTKYELINGNKKTISKYVVDDCLLESKAREEKCDYLFDVIEDKVAIFVECKGSDIIKAVRQIDSTVVILYKELKTYTKKGRIVTSRVYAPNMRGLEYIRLRAKLSGHLETKNRILTDII